MSDDWRDAIEQIRARVSLPDLIGEATSLRRTGRSYTGLCPFHQEKTPSFHVKPEGYYKCFGCGAGGDLFAFVMETRGFSFPDAVRLLAQRTGIELPVRSDGDRKKSDERKQALELMGFAGRWYSTIFRQSESAAPVREYWLSRGFTLEQAEQWQIGYTPDPDKMEEVLKRRGWSVSLAARYGLLHQRSGRYFDRYAGRLIFPITNRFGQIAGFAGRALSAEQKAKYINSPETPAFHKSHLLYGLDHAVQMKGSTSVLVTEGYFDVLRMQVLGHPAVAPMGTALTPEQAVAMRRGFDQVILAFDGDVAGRKATLRSIPILANAGVEVSVMNIPDGEDLDTLGQKDKEQLSTLIAEVRPGIEFMIESMAGTSGSIQKKDLAAREISKSLEDFDNPDLVRLAALHAEKILGLSLPQAVSRRPIHIQEPAPVRPKPTVNDGPSNTSRQLVAAAINETRRSALLESECRDLLDDEMVAFVEGSGPCPSSVAQFALKVPEVDDKEWSNLLQWGINIVRDQHRKERLRRLADMANAAQSDGDWDRYIKLMRAIRKITEE